MRNSKWTNIVLWIGQSFLALFFIAASGAPKFFLPPELLNMPIQLPTAVLWLIGTCEILGGLGLIVPGVLRIRPGLVVAAALGLVALTLCATVYQLLAGQPESAAFALGMGAIAAAVAYGRWRLAPIPPRHGQQSPPVAATTLVVP